ncbi:hypothetical protein MTP99_016987 [Tenebrio molitor]|nr:hypothetical protein MTP99_016987 [Tenebrio molitor]
MTREIRMRHRRRVDQSWGTQKGNRQSPPRESKRPPEAEKTSPHPGGHITWRQEGKMPVVLLTNPLPLKATGPQNQPTSPLAPAPTLVRNSSGRARSCSTVQVHHPKVVLGLR